MQKRAVWALLWLVCVPGWCAAQRRFTAMTTAHGLPQNSVECFVQDAAGYLWIGTQDGLARFDGHRLKVFRSSGAGQSGLSDHFITSLYVDSKQRLWVGTRNGLNLFDSSSETFFKYLPDTNALHQSVTAVYENSHGQVMANFPRATYALTNQKPKKTNSLMQPGVAEKLPEQFWSKNQQGQWAALLEGRLVINKDTVELPRGWGASSLSRTMLVATSNGFVVLADGLFEFDSQGNLINDFPRSAFNGASSFHYVMPISNELWVSTDAGLYIVNTKSLHVEHCFHNAADPFSLSYDFVHSTYADRQGHIWIGCANKGLNIHDPATIAYSYLSTHSTPALPDPLVWCAYREPNGRFWVGTAGGIVALDHFDPENPAAAEVFRPKALQLLRNVRAIVRGADGGLWIGTSHDGLFRWHQGKLSQWQSREFTATEVSSLSLAADGTLWVGTYAGLFTIATNGKTSRLDKRLGVSSYIMKVAASGRSVQVAHVHGFAEVVMTESDTLVSTVASVPGDSNSLPFSIVSGAAKVGQQWWLGMYDRGVALVENGRVTRLIDERDGLSGHVVESISRLPNGVLAVATNQGLSLVNESTLKIRNIGPQNGLRNQEFAMGANFLDADGVLYLGSVDGLLFFDADALTEKPEAMFPVQVVELEVNYSPRFLPQSQANIELQPNEKVFSVSFSAMQLVKAASIYYEHRLVGFDNHWVRTTDGRGIATYSNLSPGRYTLEMRALEPDGHEAAQPKRLSILVLPPFHALWWVRLGAVLLLVLVTASAARLYTHWRWQQKLAELKAQQRIQAERERISRDLHDNVGSQITYMISSLDTLGDSASEPVHHEIGELSAFARTTMQQLRETIWVMNKERIVLAEFKNKLDDYCRKMLVASHDYSIVLVGNEQLVLEPNTVLHLFRLFQESVTNAMKHAQCSRIEVFLSTAEGGLIMEVADNGIGMQAATRNDHYGLENMKARVAELKGTIEWMPRQERGTMVRLWLPV